MKFLIWPFRIIILLYFFYKVYLAYWTLYVSDRLGLNANPGTMSGTYVGFILIAFIFGAFCFYQIRQSIIEIRHITATKKIRFRLLSIIFSIIFFTLSATSIVNLDFSQIEILDYLIEFYTLFTLVAFLSSIIVTMEDINLYRELRQKSRLFSLNRNQDKTNTLDEFSFDANINSEKDAEK
ncbi:MAG: hypothetical protein ACKVQB_09705 [Bacteroidia bacterium]